MSDFSQTYPQILKLPILVQSQQTSSSKTLEPHFSNSWSLFTQVSYFVPFWRMLSTPRLQPNSSGMFGSLARSLTLSFLSHILFACFLNLGKKASVANQSQYQRRNSEAHNGDHDEASINAQSLQTRYALTDQFLLRTNLMNENVLRQLSRW